MEPKGLLKGRARPAGVTAGAPCGRLLGPPRLGPTARQREDSKRSGFAGTMGNVRRMGDPAPRLPILLDAKMVIYDYVPLGIIGREKK